jgi:hypothetical protein
MNDVERHWPPCDVDENGSTTVLSSSPTSDSVNVRDFVGHDVLIAVGGGESLRSATRSLIEGDLKPVPKKTLPESANENERTGTGSQSTKVELATREDEGEKKGIERLASKHLVNLGALSLRVTVS